MKPWMPILAAALLVSASAAKSPEDAPAIRITDQQVPPSWAVKQRLLIETQNRAVEQFYAHYVDQRGWYKGHLTWGIGIGSDDIMQGLANWPLFYALGGSQEVLQKYYKAFHGNVAQLSSQKVEAAPPWGVMHNGFVAADDMFHIEEWYQAFNQIPVADPHNAEFRELTLRFAGFFLNEGLPKDAEPIYDYEHDIIRSGVIGSRGAILQIDDAFWGFGWKTITANPPGHLGGHLGVSTWTNVRGDTPPNFGATTFVSGAYLLTGEAKYRRWVEDYIGAWCERAAKNDGIFPANVGLSGIVGEHWDGQWWRHMHGTWSLPYFRSILTGVENAMLVSGNDSRYLGAIRRQVHSLHQRGFEHEGKRYAASSFDGQKWGGRANLDSQFVRLYLTDFRADDLALMREDIQKWGTGTRGAGCPFYFPPNYAWMSFLLGDNPGFPEQMLDSDLERLRVNMEDMQRERQVARNTCGVTAGRVFRDRDWERNTEAHHWHMPSATHSLIQLACGGMGLSNGKENRPVLAEVWHFDPEANRPGLPPDVAALVDKITRSAVGIHLVNVSQTSPRTLVVQTGAYGEHQCLQVTHNGKTTEVNSHYLVVHLAPGSGGYLELKVKRFANPPKARLPWQPSSRRTTP